MPKGHYGLAGLGRSGRVDVDVDEELDEPGHVQMTIDLPGWSFRFRLSARTQASRILGFVREQTGSLVFSEITIGSFVGAPVLLVKDREMADRFWLKAAKDGQIVEFMLAGEDVADLTEAVSQAVQD